MSSPAPVTFLPLAQPFAQAAHEAMEDLKEELEKFLKLGNPKPPYRVDIDQMRNKLKLRPDQDYRPEQGYVELTPVLQNGKVAFAAKIATYTGDTKKTLFKEEPRETWSPHDTLRHLRDYLEKWMAAPPARKSLTFPFVSALLLGILALAHSCHSDDAEPALQAPAPDPEDPPALSIPAP